MSAPFIDYSFVFAFCIKIWSNSCILSGILYLECMPHFPWNILHKNSYVNKFTFKKSLVCFYWPVVNIRAASLSDTPCTQVTYVVSHVVFSSFE